MCRYVHWLTIIIPMFVFPSRRTIFTSSYLSPAITYDAVTRFEGLERYYLQVRNRNELQALLNSFRRSPGAPIEPAVREQRIQVSKDVCASILNSDFFDMRQEDYLDSAVDEIRAEIQRDHPHIFRSIYTRTNAREYVYENSYRRRFLYFGDEEVAENTITCVTRGRTSRKIRNYYISQLYNVNRVLDELPILGRFIFRSNRFNEVTLMALAEEAAQSNRLLRYARSIEWFYLNGRSDVWSTVPWQLNPICGLKKRDKLRICAIIFAAKAFKNSEFTFKPTIGNVRRKCVRKRIAFTAPGSVPVVGAVVRWMASKTETYEEWVIGCQAKTHEGNPVTFYVSNTNEVNEAFVFVETGTDDRIVVYDWFSNISVIGEALL